MKKHAAILLMAGSSTRFEANEPKQFSDFLGSFLYQYPLRQFLACGFDQICLVCPKTHLHLVDEKLNVVVGGATRQESVLLALKALNQEIQAVTIHDAARALVSLDLIQAHKKAAQTHDAISSQIPVQDTIYEVHNDELTSIPDRSSLKIGQTPQTFDRKLLEKAHKEFKGEASDDAMMVQSLGQKIHLLEGEVNNFKITYAKDLHLAKLIAQKL